ncbi:MAG: BON domain-containing protein [Desulfobulbaceae bacterium]|nr:BON domain-containing protein [Desulfobulbaceae bacterium]
MIHNDEVIKKNIVDTFFADSRIDASKITITVEEGMVSLAGSVPAYADLATVRSIVWRIPGVVSLVDNMEVSYVSPSLIPDDAEIEKRANNIIVWDQAIDEAHVRAKVGIGIITLEGTVDAFWKKEYIEKRVMSIRGVLGIKNKLAIIPSRKIRDEVVAENIVQKLDKDIRVNAEDVTVAVKDGVITLTGQIPNWVARQSILDDVSRTHGVVAIENNLEVVM